MKHLQKLVPIVLAFVLALSLSLTALAEEDYGQEVTGNDNLFQNNEAQTTFSVVAVPANLSATVPLNVTFAVKRNGDFVCCCIYFYFTTSIYPNCSENRN